MRTFALSFLLVAAVTVAQSSEIAESEHVTIDKRFLSDTFDDVRDFFHKAEDTAKKYVHKAEDFVKKFVHKAENAAEKVLSNVDVVNLLKKAVDYIDSTVAVLGCSKIAEEVKDVVEGDQKSQDETDFKDICKTALGLLEKIAKRGLLLLENHASKHD